MDNDVPISCSVDTEFLQCSYTDVNSGAVNNLLQLCPSADSDDGECVLSLGPSVEAPCSAANLLVVPVDDMPLIW